MGRIILGDGETWSFTAVEAVTSGNIVWLSGTEKIGKCHYSGAPLGVALIPASVGRPCSVALQGIVEVLTTGAVTVGAWLQPTNGKAMVGVGVSGAGEYGSSSRSGGYRSLTVGKAIEAPTRNSLCKIILAL